MELSEQLVAIKKKIKTNRVKHIIAIIIAIVFICVITGSIISYKANDSKLTDRTSLSLSIASYATTTLATVTVFAFL